MRIWHRTLFSQVLGVIGAVVLLVAGVTSLDDQPAVSRIGLPAVVTLGFAIWWFRPMVAVADSHLVVRNAIMWRWANLAQVESTDRELNFSNSYTIQFRVYPVTASLHDVGYDELPASMLGKPGTSLPFVKYQSDQIVAEVLRLAAVARGASTHEDAPSDSGPSRD